MKIIRTIREARDPGVNYTPGEKVDMHENGKSPINIGRCGDDKLINYYKIACRKGYVKSATDFLNEMRARGLQVPAIPAFPSSVTGPALNTIQDEIKKIFNKIKPEIDASFKDISDKIEHNYFAMYFPSTQFDDINIGEIAIRNMLLNEPTRLRDNVYRAIKDNQISYNDIEEFLRRDFKLFKDELLYAVINVRMYTKRLSDHNITFSKCEIRRNYIHIGTLYIEFDNGGTSTSKQYAHYEIGVDARKSIDANRDSVVDEFILNKNKKTSLTGLYLSFQFRSGVKLCEPINIEGVYDRNGIFENKVLRKTALNLIESEAQRIFGKF